MDEWIDLIDKSANVDQWGAASIDRLADVPWIANYMESPIGALFDASPVTLEQWGGVAVLGETGMEHWQSCLNLMLHV